MTPEQFIESALEGRRITQVVPFLREILADAPSDAAERPSAILTTDHVFALALQAEREKGARVVCDFTRPRFDTRDKTIYIPAPLGPDHYAVALHEFGHVFGPGQEGQNTLAAQFSEPISPSHPIYRKSMRAVVESEMGAWQWAVENAVIWTEEMGRRSGEALLSYFMHEIRGTDNVRQEFYNTLEMIVRFRKHA